MSHEVSASGNPGFDGFEVSCSCGGWRGWKGWSEPAEMWPFEAWEERQKHDAAEAWRNHVKLSRLIETYDIC